MRLVVHPSAEADLETAAAFYEREASSKLAARFVQEFKRVCAVLKQHPNIGSKRSQQRRGFPLRDFPFTVIYSVKSEELRILVVKHDRRRPNYGAGRT